MSTPMTKILSVVEVVEAIRQRHIHLKANNPVGFVHLFADIKKALTSERDAGARDERKKIGTMIEEANYARKVGEKTGDPIAVWEVQDVIRQILTLTAPTK